MNLDYLQKGLSNWLWLQPEKLHSFNTLKNVCEQLYFQANQDGKENFGFQRILLPLLRVGIIEFYGSNKFGLSPSAIFYNNHSILYWNTRNINWSQSFIIPFESPFEIKICRYQPDCLLILTEVDQKPQKFCFKDYIERFPSFTAIIKAWDNDVVNDDKDFFFLNHDIGWERTPNQPMVGVFRKSKEVYSQRILKLEKDGWKTIPKRENNIESLNVAMNWAMIKNNSKMKLYYESKLDKLIIDDYYFPFLLERVLFVNTLLNKPDNFKVFMREYFLSRQDFNFLNKLFHYKIPVI